MFYRQTIKNLEEKVAQLNLVIHNALGLMVNYKPKTRRIITNPIETKKKILALLKDGPKSAKTIISQFPDTSYSKCYYHLNQLENSGKVKRVVNGGRVIWEAI